MAPGPVGWGIAAVTDAVTVEAPAQAGDGGIAKAEEVIEKLKAVSLALHEEAITK